MKNLLKVFSLLSFATLIVQSSYAQISTERFAQIKNAVYGNADGKCLNSYSVISSDSSSLILRSGRNDKGELNSFENGSLIYKIDFKRSKKELVAKNKDISRSVVFSEDANKLTVYGSKKLFKGRSKCEYTRLLPAVESKKILKRLVDANWNGSELSLTNELSDSQNGKVKNCASKLKIDINADLLHFSMTNISNKVASDYASFYSTENINKNENGISYLSNTLVKGNESISITNSASNSEAVTTTLEIATSYVDGKNSSAGAFELRVSEKSGSIGYIYCQYKKI